MMRASGIAGAFVVALALTPISADAQQIFPCVKNNRGSVRIIAQNVPCRSDESLVTWNVVGPQGPPGSAGPTGATGPQGPAGPAGVLAFMQCFLTVPVIPFNFNCSSGDVASILSDGGAGTSSGSFKMQPGTYQVQFYAGSVLGCGGVFPTIDNIGVGVTWLSSGVIRLPLCAPPPPLGIIAGAVIMQFSSNQILRFDVTPQPTSFPIGATLIFTKLQ